MKFSLSTFLLLLFSNISFLFAGDPYFIGNFSRDISGLAENCAGGTVLENADPILNLDALSAGRTYLRQKNKNGEYVLRQAELDSNVYEKLKTFSRPNLELGEWYQLKLFNESKKLPEEDIGCVVMDNDYAYLQNFNYLHVNDAGSWVKLEGLHNSPIHLMLNTSPPGVKAKWNSELFTSPIYKSFSDSLIPWIQIAEKSFYPKQIILTPDSSKFYKLNVELKQLPLPKPSTSNLELANWKIDSLGSYNSNQLYVLRDSLLSFQQRTILGLDSAKNLWKQELEPVPLNIDGEDSIRAQNRLQAYYRAKVNSESYFKGQYQSLLDSLGGLLGKLQIVLDTRERQLKLDTITIPIANKKHVDNGLELQFQNSNHYSKFLAKEAEVNREDTQFVAEHWNVIYNSAELKQDVVVGYRSLYKLHKNKMVFLTGKWSFDSAMASSSIFLQMEKRTAALNDSLNRQQEDEKKRAQLRKEAKTKKIKELRNQHRKKWFRWGTGLLLSGIGSGFAVYSYLEAKDGDKSYEKYQAAINREEAKKHRSQVESSDEKSEIFGALSAISFGVSFFIITF